MTTTDVILIALYAIIGASTAAGFARGRSKYDAPPLWCTIGVGLLWPVTLPLMALS